ncbi:MAG: hypothetical protein WKF96_19165 [Solirubrobacteraceae bacterium]
MIEANADATTKPSLHGYPTKEDPSLDHEYTDWEALDTAGGRFRSAAHRLKSPLEL